MYTFVVISNVGKMAANLILHVTTVKQRSGGVLRSSFFKNNIKFVLFFFFLFFLFLGIKAWRSKKGGNVVPPEAFLGQYIMASVMDVEEPCPPKGTFSGLFVDEQDKKSTNSPNR